MVQYEVQRVGWGMTYGAVRGAMGGVVRCDAWCGTRRNGGGGV